MNILRWHVHGSWATAFVQGGHHVTLPVLPVLPVLPGRGPDGRGRSRDRLGTVEELPPGRPRERDHGLVVRRRPREAALVRAWIGREPGAGLPALDALRAGAARDIPVVHTYALGVGLRPAPACGLPAPACGRPGLG